MKDKNYLPGLVVVVDARKEKIAVAEAARQVSSAGQEYQDIGQEYNELIVDNGIPDDYKEGIEKPCPGDE